MLENILDLVEKLGEIPGIPEPQYRYVAGRGMVAQPDETLAMQVLALPGGKTSGTDIYCVLTAGRSTAVETYPQKAGVGMAVEQEHGFAPMQSLTQKAAS